MSDRYTKKQIRRTDRILSKDRYTDEQANEHLYVKTRAGLDWYKNLNTALANSADPDEVAQQTVTPLSYQQEQANIQAAADRINNTEDPTILGTAMDTVKGVSRTTFSAADGALRATQNAVMDQMQDMGRVHEDANIKSVFEAVNPLDGLWTPDTYTNTDLATQISAAKDGGFSAGFGEEGTGDGFFIDEASPVGLEKDKRAHEFWTLANGDAATIGRATMSALGASKDSDWYKIGSGAIDAATILGDPLNAVAPIKAAKVAATAAKAASALNKIDSGKAVLAATKLGESATPEVRAALDEITTAEQALVATVLINNPELKKPIKSLFSKTVSMREKTNIINTLAKRNAANLKTGAAQKVHRLLQIDADTAASATAAAVDKVNDLNFRLEQLASRKAKAVQDAKEEVDPQKAQESLDEASALDRKITGMSEQRDLLQDSIDATVDAKTTRLSTDDEVNALRGELEAAIDDLGLKSQTERDAVQRFVDSRLNLESLVRGEMGKRGDISVDDTRSGLEALIGVADDKINVTTFVNFVNKGDAADIAAVVAAVNSPAQIFRLFGKKVTARTANALAETSNIDDVYAVLLDGARRGDVLSYKKNIANYMTGKGMSSSKAAERAMLRSQAFFKTSVATPGLVNVNKTEDVANLTLNTINTVLRTSRKRGAELMDTMDYADGWITKILATEGRPTATKSVWIQLQRDLIRRTPGFERLEPEVQRMIEDHVDAIHKQYLDDNHRLDEIKADGPSKILENPDTPGIFSPDMDNAIVESSELADNLFALDYEKLRGLMTRTADDLAAGKYKNKSDYLRTVSDVYDKYFRPFYLIRVGYVLLQLGDSSARNALMGANSLLTHPMNTSRIAAGFTVGKYPVTSKLLGKLAKRPVGPDGKPLLTFTDEQTVAYSLQDEMNKELSEYFSQDTFRDYNRRTDSKVTKSLGWTTFKPTDAEYTETWAKNLYANIVSGHDHMLALVFDVEATGKLPAYLVNYKKANMKRLHNATPQDVVYDYLWHGPGKKEREALIGASWNENGNPLTRALGNPDTFRRLLYDANDSASYVSRAHYLTGSFDEDLSALIEDLRKAHIEQRDAIDANGNATKSYVKTVRTGKDADGNYITTEVNISDDQAIEKLIRATARKVSNPPPVIRGRVKDTQKKNTERIRSGMSWFFGKAGDFEKATAHLPYYTNLFNSEVAKRVAFLSPEDARTTAENISKNFGKVPSEMDRRTKQILRESLKEASGDGSFTIEDITRSAHRSAMEQMTNGPYYGTQGRNQAAKDLVLMAPFFQASANSYKFYLKGGMQHKMRVVNATRLWRNSQTEESGALYDMMPGPDRADPSRGIVWLDEFGQSQLTVPILQFNVRTDMWNPLNFGEPLPGPGPGLTMPAALLMGRFPALEANTPIEFRNWINKYRPSDINDAKSAAQAVLPGTMSLFIDEDAAMSNYAAAATALFAANRQEYLNPETGYFDEHGKNKLANDAREYADTIAMGKQARSFFFRGGTSDERLVKDVNGNMVTAAVFYEDWKQSLDSSGVAGQAYYEMIQKYGINNLMYLAGARQSVLQGTSEGYDFALENEDVAMSVPDVLGAFFPATELADRSPDFQRLMTEMGNGERKGMEELAADVDKMLFQAETYKLEEGLASGKLSSSQYDVEKKALAQRYKLAIQEDRQGNWNDQILAQYRDAVGNEVLGATPQGQVIGAYLQYRDQLVAKHQDGETLVGVNDTALRAHLKAKGEELALAVPEFNTAWTKHLRWEVEE